MLNTLREVATSALKSPARLLSDGDRSMVEAEIHDAGQLTNVYGFMLFSACGIAALGLLQSSAPVIIGAMLISPLMGPIVSMGMALARVDPPRFRTAALTLLIGALLSVLASTLIVWASPLKDVTPEILARTRPTLLDMVVALLSGFVGAYLSINRKGGAIAGVAIATSLMPPLAVVGYGLATAAWDIAGGALLLFLTNVVAILVAVFGVARRYGFRSVGRQGAAWETPALVGVMVALCIPLAMSLQGIVFETRETNRARGAINQTFADTSPHITELKVEAQNKGATQVQAVVVTRRYIPGAEAQVAAQLDPGAQVEIEQILTAKGAAELNSSALAARLTATTQPQPASPEQRLRAMLGAVGEVQSIEKNASGLTVAFNMNRPGGLQDYFALEQAAQRFMPQTPITLIPPLAPLPEVRFAYGSTSLSPEAAATVDAIAWALIRWGVAAAKVEGLASPDPRGRRPADLRVAQGRASVVGERLRAQGIKDVALSANVPDTLTGDEAQYLVARVTMQPTAPSSAASPP
ncbi:MAG: DUF389 domain-containing protein [Phenylobacterium sp.]|uniref:DUF389 domain-containing protein n=1 Tax=Phenylobacterium sp. TaxID=1871053 RepID=UPI00271B306E|nr:DUF389 domain-containing protein [Phenylobacterium sp.]MDO9430272.1 DUF389 domain-containing protein [Phenylobacterium sp.]